MRTFRYFAYGSNMLTPRLHGRCPSAVPRATAVAAGHAVTFGMPSTDRSGKAALTRTLGAARPVRGVVFEISRTDLASLDAAEGGYERRADFPVEIQTGEVMPVHTYLPRAHDSRLRPYDWYLALMLAGIAEHGLGEDYAAQFRASPYEIDPQPDRASRCLAMRALERAGFGDYAALFAAGGRREPAG